jgi:hypothetical protein
MRGMIAAAVVRSADLLAGAMGLEPATFGVTGRRSLNLFKAL